jgi:hypothetical protein
VATRALRRYASERVALGLDLLVAAQDLDGLWRDYNLVLGPSEGWTTSYIGWLVSQFAAHHGCAAAVRRAAAALLTIRAPGGWGYDRDSIADADSTAWTLRFLHGAGFRLGISESTRLEDFVDGAGRAHTFESTEYGTWSDAHDDVTPVVGMALLASNSCCEALRRVRKAVIDAQRADGLWTSFWWASASYASFWSVYFLRRTGGLPGAVRGRIRASLFDAPLQGCTLDEALWLLLALESEHPDSPPTERLVHRILETSGERGWAGSPLLLVPKRFENDTASPLGPHADTRGLMTTAVACWALARWEAQCA